MKKQIQPTPQLNPHTDKILEHILVKQKDHHDLASRQREVQIMQHEKHEKEKHFTDGIKIQLQHSTNEKLDKLLKKFEEPLEAELEII